MINFKIGSYFDSESLQGSGAIHARKSSYDGNAIGMQAGNGTGSPLPMLKVSEVFGFYRKEVL